MKLFRTKKNVQTKKKEAQNVQTVGDFMSPTTEAVLSTRTKPLGNMWSKTKFHMPPILKQASPPPPNNTFNFTAEQFVSLVTNVVIQIAQPQLCTKNLTEKQVQAKSDLSK